MSIIAPQHRLNPDHILGEGGDSVHPGPTGHTVMAWAILKELRASPLVSRMEVDFTEKRLVAAKNCQIDDLIFDHGGFRFSRLDAALPMPIDKNASGALPLAPILDDLNRYDLQVTGLPPATYLITIDGTAVTNATAAQLAGGLNLALQAGPVTQQSQHVLGLVFEKNNDFFTRWRAVQLFEVPDWAKCAELSSCQTKELNRLDAVIADLERQIDVARKPQSRKFEIKPLN